MRAYLARRLGQLLVVMCLSSLVVWLLIYAVPGSPETTIAGPNASPEQLAEVRGRLGLDRPVPVQYVTWLGNAVVGDLGQSLTSRVAVTELLGQRLPATFQLVLATVLLGLAIAVPVGTWAALRPRGAVARAATTYQVLLLATPSFWLGIIFIWLFGLKLGWFATEAQYFPILSDPLGAVENLALPALTLGLFMGAVLVRFVRSAVTDALHEPHIRTARAKGASELRVTVNHALRNASLPVITITGLQLGAFIGGTVVTESIFNYPGLGRLVYTAVVARDYPVVQGALLVVVLSFVVINMIVDLLYAVLDPRVRLS